jgi:hypothetical protein
MKIKTLLLLAVTSTTVLCANEKLSESSSNNPVEQEVAVVPQLINNNALAGDITLQSENVDQLFDFAGDNTLVIETSDAKNIGYIKEGDWVKYSNVDLTGIVSFSVNLASNKVGDRTITMHLDNGAGAPGTAIGIVFQSGKTGGWQTYVDSDVATFSQSVTGVQNVYFVFGAGNINVDFFTLNYDASSLSVSDNFKDKINYYPNPVSEALTIAIPAGEYSQFTIIDVTGKVIKKETIQSDLREVKLNVSDLSNGMYLIKLKGIKNRTFKFMKE